MNARVSRSEAAFLAVAADADFLYGAFTDGLTEQAHGRATHSLAAAVGAGLLWGLFTDRQPRGQVAVDAAVIYASHLLLDSLAKESDDGMPLLWPLSRKRFALDVSVFETIRRTRGRKFLPGLWNRSNRRAVAREARLLAGPLVLGMAIGFVRRW